MAAEINLNRLLRQLPELQTTVVENRRYIWIPVTAVIGYYLLKDPVKDALHRFFAWVYYKYLLKDVNMALLGYRRRMKKQLESQEAQDPHSHNDDTLRILEIGMGPGANMEFYPRSSRVFGLEPNPYFVRELNKLKESYPNLVKVIQGHAEDLKEISNESVDAVVSTLVLCSVTDLDKSIEEVKRVLVKGGRFYFFEHQACQVSWKRYLLQIVVNPFWRIIFDGCQVCRQTHRQLEAHGFDMSQTTQEVGYMWYIVRSTTQGYAIKE